VRQSVGRSSARLQRLSAGHAGHAGGHVERAATWASRAKASLRSPPTLESCKGRSGRGRGVPLGWP